MQRWIIQRAKKIQPSTSLFASIDDNTCGVGGGKEGRSLRGIYLPQIIQKYTKEKRFDRTLTLILAVLSMSWSTSPTRTG